MKLFQQLSVKLGHIQNEPSRQIAITVNGETKQLEGFQRRERDEIFNPSADVMGFGADGRPNRQSLEF